MSDRDESRRPRTKATPRGRATAGDHPTPVGDDPDRYARRLKKLFADNPTISIRRAAADITADGTPLSFAYLSQLVSGAKKQPRTEITVALARYFEVSMNFFTESDDELKRQTAEQEVTDALGSARVKAVALRAADLSPAGLKALTAMIRELEQTPGMTRRRPPRAK